MFLQFDLHKLCYRDVRERFRLTAQPPSAPSPRWPTPTSSTNRQTHFPPAAEPPPTTTASCPGKLSASSLVSIWSLDGRLSIPFVCGERQRSLLANRKGETDIVQVRGQWCLMATCKVADGAPLEATEFLGVDLGVANIASDSDGKRYSGSAVKAVPIAIAACARSSRGSRPARPNCRFKKLAGPGAPVRPARKPRYFQGDRRLR